VCAYSSVLSDTAPNVGAVICETLYTLVLHKNIGPVICETSYTFHGLSK